jgi:ATP-dependent Clp protease adaptor protein ClpS
MTTDTVIEKKKTTSRKLQVPKKYKVVVCNDEVTPIEFVIAMLIGIFKHSHDQAYDLTMAVHQQGSAIAGIYNYEIAEQKALDGINLARSHGYPLLIKVEEE